MIGIAFGGTFLLRILSGGHPANALQKAFFRAGHAHAGVLVTVGLVLAVLGAASRASPGWAGAGAIVVLLAAIFIPLGVWSGACGATRKHITSGARRRPAAAEPDDRVGVGRGRVPG